MQEKKTVVMCQLIAILLQFHSTVQHVLLKKTVE